MIFYWITVFSVVAAATNSEWVGDYEPVEGLCQQAKCCCVTGLLTISESEVEGDLQVDAPLSGDVPCHSEDQLSTSFLMINDKVAVGHDWDPLIMTMLESGEILDLTDLTKRDASAPTHNCHNFLRKTNSSTRAAWGPWSDCSATCGLGLRHRVCQSGNCIGASTERCIMPPCQAAVALGSDWIGSFEPVEGLCQQDTCCCVTGLLKTSKVGEARDRDDNIQVDAPLSGGLPCHGEDQLSSTFMVINDRIAIGHDWDPLILSLLESGEIMDLTDLTKRDPSAPTHNCHNFLRRTESAPAMWGPWSDCSSTCGVGMRHRVCHSGNCIGASTEQCTMPPCPAIGRDSEWIGDYEPVKGLCQQATCCCVTGLLTISQSGETQDTFQVDAPLSGDVPCHGEDQLSTTFMMINDEVAYGHDWDPLIMTKMLEGGEIMDLTDFTQIDSNKLSHNCHNFFKKTNSSRAAWGPWSDCSATCGVGMRHRVCPSGNCIGASTEQCTMPPCQDAEIGYKWVGRFEPVDQTLCKWADCCCVTGVLTSRRDFERGEDQAYLKIEAPLSGGVTCANEAKLETTFMIVNNTIALGHDWDPLILAMLEGGEIMEITDITQTPNTLNCHQFLRKTHHRGD